MRSIFLLISAGLIIWLCTTFVWSPELDEFDGVVRLVEGEVADISCRQVKAVAYYDIILSDGENVRVKVPNQVCSRAIVNGALGSYLQAFFNRGNLMEFNLEGVTIYEFRSFRIRQNVLVIVLIGFITFCNSTPFILSHLSRKKAYQDGKKL